ncbi:MAG: 50S ribosomal protein L29 [Puniceicoccales bacterium]|jgi:large subunit ribosomal protein L29|nr:50S ribosomal protein L29 [Puniceicoccales bacterium]
MSAKKKQASKAGKIKDLSLSDIELELNKSRQELLDLRLRKATGQVDNPIRIRAVRRDIARMITIAGQKKSAATKA